MDRHIIDMWIGSNINKFEATRMPEIRSKLEQLDSSDLTSISSIELKDPTMMLIISIFVGIFGVDRFMLGQTGMGFLKLAFIPIFLSLFFVLVIFSTLLWFFGVTLWLPWILMYSFWAVDLFLIQKLTKQYNYQKITNEFKRMNIL